MLLKRMGMVNEATNPQTKGPFITLTTILYLSGLVGVPGAGTEFSHYYKNYYFGGALGSWLAG
jgi:hypothetical protein